MSAARLNKTVKKPKEPTDWTRKETIEKLGRLTDAEVAKELGLTRERVRQVRNALGIARVQRGADTLPKELLDLLGSDRDVNLARLFDVRTDHVREARVKRGIPKYMSPCGTRTRYNSGCRCRDCMDANTVAQRDYLDGLRGDKKTSGKGPPRRVALKDDGTSKTLNDLNEGRKVAHGNIVRAPEPPTTVTKGEP